MSHLLERSGRLLGSIICAGLLAACGNGNNDDLDDRLGAAEPRARFVHAATGGPAVTLYRDGNPEKDASNVDLLTVDDPYNKSLVNDNARVRVINAAVNAPGIDVYLTPTGVDFNVVAPTMSSIGYKGVNPPTGANWLWRSRIRPLQSST